MKMADYLFLKRKQVNQESPIKKAVIDRCYRCYRSHKNCFCTFIQSFSTQTRFVILMHPKEARKEKTGTGRLSHLCLQNSEVIVDLDFTENPRVNQLIHDPLKEVFVLYPGDHSLNISENQVSLSQVPVKERVLFLIDATWPCARKMMKLGRNLQELPRLSFTVRQTSQFHIKHQPDDLCLSTIEAIYYFLDESEKQGREYLQGRHQILLDTLHRVVQFQRDCAANPDIPSYRSRISRPPRERVKAKKWEKRNLFFS